MNLDPSDSFGGALGGLMTIVFVIAVMVFA